MDPTDALGPLAALALAADALRRVYAVGRSANDHFVAAVVAGCLGFYALLYAGAPPWARPLCSAGMVGIWGLFASLDRAGPPPPAARWLLAYPSQPAYAFALWAGLVWLLRAPFALIDGGDLLWPGPWLIPPLALAALGTYETYTRGFDVHEEEVEGLPARIVHLSDLHASPLMHRPELDALVDRVNALAPDLVLITGDLVMPFSEADHRFLLDALARLRAPAFACPGNHDLPVLARLKEGLRGIGIPLLVDEAARIEGPLGGMEIVGVNFHWRGARRALVEALAPLGERPPGVTSILLAHDPRLGGWLPPGRFDLTLSGHTHGGQVAANALGVEASVLRPLGVRDQGWFPTPGGGRQRVHRGGWFTGFPPRMGVAGEIVLLKPPGGRRAPDGASSP